MTYEQAKQMRDQLESLVELATDRLRGMKADAPAYRQARKEFDAAAATLITLNKTMERTYMDEMIAEYHQARLTGRRAA